MFKYNFVYLLTMKQTIRKSIRESVIQTGIGTITGFTLMLIIFPMFGIDVKVTTVAEITLSFMLFGLTKNYLIRRLFNLLHSGKIKWFSLKQNKFQSLFESSFQTVAGTIMSFWLSILIYPLFGLDVPMMKIGGISIVFTVTSILKNYIVRRYFVKN